MVSNYHAVSDRHKRAIEKKLAQITPVHDTVAAKTLMSFFGLVQYQCTKLFWTAGLRPVEIAVVQSIPVAVGPPCPVGKAFAVQY